MGVTLNYDGCDKFCETGMALICDGCNKFHMTDKLCDGSQWSLVGVTLVSNGCDTGI